MGSHCENNPADMTNMAAMPIYGKNLTKIFSKTVGKISVNLSMKELQCLYMYTNHDHVMTLTYFKAMSIWLAYAFEWGKLLKCHFKGKMCRKLANCPRASAVPALGLNTIFKHIYWYNVPMYVADLHYRTNGTLVYFACDMTLPPKGKMVLY